MMLRGSVQQRGETVELGTVVSGAAVDSQVPGGHALVGLVEAFLGDGGSLAAAREALVSELGVEALVDAAGVIGNFQRMVRIADSTGIPVDAGTAEITADIRDDLGLNDFVSARVEGG